MQILYQVGDLLETSHSLIVHGCNAQGRMGSGIARAIRNKHPYAYQAYREKYESEGRLDMGSVLFVHSEGKIIANAITQEFYGRDGRQYVDYDSINTAIGLVNDYALEHTISHIAMPLIGAGFGGGSWEIISDIIEIKCSNSIPVVYTLDGVVPNS